MPNAACASSAALPARNSTPSRGEDPAEFAVPALEIGRQPVVAVGQSRQLVVAGNADRRGQVARGHAIDGRGDRPERPGQVRRQQVGHEDREQHRDGQPEQQETGQVRIRPGSSDDRVHRQDQQAERGHRQDGRQDQGEGQAGPEAEPLGDVVGAVSHRMEAMPAAWSAVGR
jgi:hypothetical protein